MSRSTGLFMGRETFVDTSGFYALLVKSDDWHAEAARIVKTRARTRQPFITADYVLDETITLLIARGKDHLIDRLLKATIDSAACLVLWSGEGRFRETVTFLRKHSDHPWSFTDCLMFTIMKERSIREALTTDEHFEQAGFVRLLA